MKVEDLTYLLCLSEEIGHAVIDSVFDLEILKELKTLLLENEQSLYDVFPHIEHRIEMLSKRLAKDVHHNDTIDVLLEQLRNKETKWSATRQLKSRFLGLDYDNQIVVMDLFLSMSASYRKWCYATLRQWREPKFDDRIVELWKEFREPGCRRLIASTLPAEKIEPIFSDFVYSINRKDYFTLIRRFGKDSWFQLDNELLENLCFTSSPINSYEPYLSMERCRNHYFYLWAKSLTNEVVPANTCWEIITMFLMHALRKDAREDLAKKASFFDFDYGDGITCFDLLTVSNGDRITFKDYLQCLVRMGHYNLVEKTSSWMYLVNIMMAIVIDPDTSNEDYYRERLKKYYSLAKDSLPLKYEDLERINYCTKIDVVLEIGKEWAALKKEKEEILKNSIDNLRKYYEDN